MYMYTVYVWCHAHINRPNIYCQCGMSFSYFKSVLPKISISPLTNMIETYVL